MVKNMDDVQKLGKESVEASLKSWGAISRGVQAITVELADYSKKTFEQGTAVTEKLLGAKSLDKAIEVQNEYVRSAYEGLVAEATKLGELCSDVAREAYKPFESQFGRVVPAN
jgi:phasin family protein